MQLGMIGLGRMGGNMTSRLVSGGHRVIAYDLNAAAADKGWAHVGPAGAGHFVKMVHNGIEYGLMQAYAEGFAILERRHDLVHDLPMIAKLWGSGSVIRSWLLELTAAALAENPNLEG